MKKESFYKEVNSNPDFPKLEEDIITFWQENKIFERSVDERPAENSFTFYDGPPFANGLPHYGHLLTGYVKDAVARYQTMLGKKVTRRFGWDCHGLPAELGAEKELGISGRIEIMDYGVDKFNAQCRSSVMKFSKDWETYVNRQARWIDFENDYKTMDKNYMESAIWAFKTLYDKGLVYQSMRVMPYSWACETPLSNFETRLDNSYRERADNSVTIAFTLKDKPSFAPDGCKAYKILAWTTTPWTLPSNLALAVNKSMDYSYVMKDGECLIIASFAVQQYAKELGTEEAMDTFKGSKLLNLSYEPLLPYFKDHENSFKILEGEFVTEGDGTGIVHMAPGFGEDDQIICDQHGIELVCPVDEKGRFTFEVSDFKDMHVFDANDEIIKLLKNNGSWIRTEQYLHNYPHCWRTDTPLIYKAVPSWYIKVTAIKDRMVELNKEINWVPGHVKNGLFGKWIENARDWSVSRNRFWGTPIPIWQSDNPQYPRIDVYGSIEELEKEFGVKVDDLHRPFIDTLTRPNPDDPTGKSTMRRVTDVFDCWFDSGSMPYGQAHYPFDDKEKFEKNFPADFIVEYSAQTRGWFYTLMVLSTALFDRPPFLNCICHGVILDGNGEKLSKRLKNYEDPLVLFDKYGSDALRFFMLSSPVLKGNELLIDKEGQMIKDTLRLSLKPIWNAYNFFSLYANSDGIKAEYSAESSNLMDKYILAKLKSAIEIIESSMDNYDLPSSCHEVDNFFEVLNNWYIRRNRNRFWKEEKDQDKQEAYNTLYTVLLAICRATSHLLPLLTEEIYLGLQCKGERVADESVHLSKFPDLSSVSDEKELVNFMDKVRDVCSTALSIRNDEKIRIRQPLESLTVIGKNLDKLKDYEELIKDEINVHKIIFSNDIDSNASLRLKINFPLLGKRLPSKMKEIISAVKQEKWQKLDDGRIEVLGEVLEIEECELLLQAKNSKGSTPLSTNDALVMLDLNITQELHAEGVARDLVRIVQQARKDADLHVSDRINLGVSVDEKTNNSLKSFTNYINEQTLSTTSFGSVSKKDFDYVSENELDGSKVIIGFSVK